MIDRIGQIVHAHVHGERNIPVTLTQADVETAIAILRAMRDPTDVMTQAGDDAASDLAITNDSSGVYTWQVMIDAALGDHVL